MKWPNDVSFVWEMTFSETKCINDKKDVNGKDYKDHLPALDWDAKSGGIKNQNCVSTKWYFSFKEQINILWAI